MMSDTEGSGSCHTAMVVMLGTAGKTLHRRGEEGGGGGGVSTYTVVLDT